MSMQIQLHKLWSTFVHFKRVIRANSWNSIANHLTQEACRSPTLMKTYTERPRLEAGFDHVKHPRRLGHIAFHRDWIGCTMYADLRVSHDCREKLLTNNITLYSD